MVPPLSSVFESRKKKYVSWFWVVCFLSDFKLQYTLWKSLKIRQNCDFSFIKIFICEDYNFVTLLWELFSSHDEIWSRIQTQYYLPCRLNNPPDTRDLPIRYVAQQTPTQWININISYIVGGCVLDTRLYSIAKWLDTNVRLQPNAPSRRCRFRFRAWNLQGLPVPGFDVQCQDRTGDRLQRSGTGRQSDFCGQEYICH